MVASLFLFLFPFPAAPSDPTDAVAVGGLDHEDSSVDTSSAVEPVGSFGLGAPTATAAVAAAAVAAAPAAFSLFSFSPFPPSPLYLSSSSQSEAASVLPLRLMFSTSCKSRRVSKIELLYTP